MTVGALASVAPPPLGLHSVTRRGNILADLGAAFAIDAEFAVPGEQWALNRGTAGQLLRAKYGSVGRAEVRSGVGLVLPGVGGNKAVWTQPTTSIGTYVEFVFQASAMAFSNFICPFSWHGASNGPASPGFSIYLDGARVIRAFVSDGAGASHDTSNALGVTPADATWFKVRWNLAGGATGVQAWTSSQVTSDPTQVIWNINGGSNTGVFAPFSHTAAIAIGELAYTGSSSFNGIISRGILVVDGVTLFDSDFAAQADLASVFSAKHGFGVKSGVYVCTPTTQTGSSIPAAPLDFTNGFQFVVRIAPKTWTPGVNRGITGLGTGATNGARTIFAWLDAAGAIALGVSDGTNICWPASPAVPGTTAGQYKWIRVSGNRSNGNINVTFEVADDTGSSTVLPTSWSTFGTDSRALAGAISNASRPVAIGAPYSPVSTSQTFDGLISRVIWRADSTGSAAPFADVDFTGLPDDTQAFQCTTGQTVTMSGATPPSVTVTAANAVDTNDPLLLPWTGENYVYFPPVSGNLVSTVTTPSMYPTNGVQFEVDFDFGPTAWAARYGLFVLNGFTAAGNNAILGVDTWSNGGFIVAYGNGSTASDYVLLNASPLTGRQRWRFTVDTATPNRTTVAHYWNGTAWVFHQMLIDGDATPIAPMTAGGTTAIIGSGNAVANGIIYSIDVRDGTLATILSWRGSDMGQTGGVSGGRTWTIGRATSGRKSVVVTRPVWLFGTDDYLEVADNDLLDFTNADSFTALAVVRDWGRSATLGTRVGKRAVPYTPASPEVGWVLLRNTGDVSIATSDGSNLSEDKQALPTAGSLVVESAVVTPATLLSYANTTAAGTTAHTAAGTLANALAMRIGRLAGTGAAYAEAEILAVGLFRRALTPAEIATIVANYGAAA